MFSVAVSEEIANNETSKLVKSKIQEHTELNNIFSGVFSGDDYQNIENPVLNIARSAVRPSPFLNSENSQAEDELSTIEDSLKNLKSVLDDEEYTTVISDLRSSEFNQSLGALTHIRLYDYLRGYDFEINPEPSLSNDNCSDLELCQDEVIIEVTSLGTSMIQQRIEAMLESVGGRILNKLSDPLHLNFYLRVDRFSETAEGLWDLESTEERIITHFEGAEVLELLDLSSENKVSFWPLSSENILSKKVSEMHYYDERSNFGRLIEENSEKDIVSQILRKNVGEVVGPIDSVASAEAGDKMVIFSNVETFPDPEGPGEKREKIFLDRLKTKIKDKIDSEQREDSMANVVVVSASFWPYKNYSSGGSRFVDAEKKLRDNVMDILENEKPEDLAAVFLTEQNPENMLVIENPFCEEEIAEIFENSKFRSLFSTG